MIWLSLNLDFFMQNLLRIGYEKILLFTPAIFWGDYPPKSVPASAGTEDNHNETPHNSAERETVKRRTERRDNPMTAVLCNSFYSVIHNRAILMAKTHGLSRAL